ncbi:MAG: glycosyltransferase family protein, partial [Kiloniellales bacterium]
TTAYRVRPDVLLFELFPFGRRRLRFEIDPLLEHARAAGPRPLVVSSMRDILVTPSKAGRVEEIVELVAKHFDLVLIHGDPTFIPFDSTFPAAVQIADRLRYTGYVVEPPAMGSDGATGLGEVLVSAGSGAVSERIFEAALEARALSRLADVPWRALVGHSLPEASFRRLRRRAPDGLIVERARPDFASLLAVCRLSISQGGYNTVMEVLQAGAPCVTVPFAGGIETEQTLRCRLLARRGVLQMVAEDSLSPDRLAAAVAAALDGPAASAAGIATDGLECSTALVLEALRAHRATAFAAPAPSRQIG